jgi:murein DD-endopeptidase MepM/ murein hydrolase activator NlpD
MVWLAACGGAAGLRHRVEAGESLWRIGKAYGVSHEVLARVNRLEDPSRIEAGQVLIVPHASRRLPVAVITPEQARPDRPAPLELPAEGVPFIWPVAGEVSSRFGTRGASHHDGIDIRAPEGTPIRAARAGRVLYSDRLRGYGNLVIVEHDRGYATVYAHIRESLVGVDARIRQGQVIGAVGRTGKTSGPNLHFEIRKDNVARNPLFFLPAPPAAQRAAIVVEEGR